MEGPSERLRDITFNLVELLLYYYGKFCSSEACDFYSKTCFVVYSELF